jgi:agmatinase
MEDMTAKTCSNNAEQNGTKMGLTVAPQRVRQTFMDFDLALGLENLKADIAILGVPYGNPYNIDEVSNDQTNAPTAIRRASRRISGGLNRWDFDLGCTLFDGKPIRIVDCGDVPADARDLDGHYHRAEEAVRLIRHAGALPIVLGGDHGVTIPALGSIEGCGPITLIQIDAHLDWIDTKFGVRQGYSSPIRRASEMNHIGEIFQIGLRCQGSARREEVEAATAYGAHLITDLKLQDSGMERVLEQIPDGGKYYLTIDADGFDPAVMPAVAGPAPGGVTYPQARKLIHGLVAKGRVVGMDIVEITPKHDVNQITAITAGNLILNMIGKAIQAGYFD